MVRVYLTSVVELEGIPRDRGHMSSNQGDSCLLSRVMESQLFTLHITTDLEGEISICPNPQL